MWTLYFCHVLSFFFHLFFLTYSQPSQIGCLPYFYTWCYPSANLECRSETCCTQLAGNAGPKNCQTITIWAPSHNFGTYRQSEKNLLSSNISPIWPYNIVNFCLLAAEIVSLVWGTSANFNGFRVLAAFLHGALVLGISETLRRWTEGVTYIWQGGHHVGHSPTF